MFLPHEVIRRKRDGERLSTDDLTRFVAGVTDGSIPDYQAAAMLMAIYFRGLDDAELAAWADAMLRSGDVLTLPSVTAPKVDKHSTGGVGDKISLPLAPAVAACGIAVPMVSGRGLGHTGGTLDKLEAIPGFRVTLGAEEFEAQVARIGLALAGQTDRIAPADRKLYALRDVTATVESIPLIASSIMSKKLAEGIDALVLDCKVGSGAFMKTRERARDLGRTIRAIGHAAGKRVTVALTSMDEPIGRAVGNALEVEESIAVLRGGGPKDTRALTVALGAEMLLLGGVAASHTEAAAAIERALDDGRALEKFRAVVVAQGGDPRVCDEPHRVLAQAPHTTEVLAPRAGTIAAVDACAVGMASLVLGGGRRQKEDSIDPAVGLTVRVRLGERVERGQPLVTLHHRGGAASESAAQLALGAYTIGDEPVTPPPLLLEVMS
ncbi:MAG: thymidine phosphorylase [Myxococcales bacterium]|nr:thymidine phosphorylase [Myxococcales bacterium]